MAVKFDRRKRRSKGRKIARILLATFITLAALWHPLATHWHLLPTSTAALYTADDHKEALGFKVNSKVSKTKTSQAEAASKPSRKWAYAFVVGGALHPQSEHRGFLAGVAVAAQKLKEAGSVADFILLIQISYASPETTLPSDQTALLHSVGVQIEYIPPFRNAKVENFYSIMLEKFRILNLTRYSRVLFLDSDVMPLCNLDYLMDLSDPAPGQPAQLQPNVVLAQKGEPSHGGLFVLEPGYYEELLQIVQRHEEECLKLPWPHFDEDYGWGHNFSSTDYWRAPVVKQGLRWDWHGSHADQGLLYYYTRYARKSVSLIIWDQIEHWTQTGNGTLHLESTSQSLLNQFSCRPPYKTGEYKPPSPYRDYHHFTGKKCINFL